MTPVYPHQESVFRELLRTGHAFFSTAWKQLPIRPRFNRLVVGESGSGKSFLGRALGSALKLPLWDITATNWIPLGCSERGARPSWLDVVDFVGQNEQSIVIVDEIDKLGTENAIWMSCVRAEIFGLLDHEVPTNLLRKVEPWDEDEGPNLAIIRKRLRDSVFLLGAGAFQSLWDTDATPMIGFGATESCPTEKMHHRRLTEVLPTELLNRFAPPVLVLPRLSREDYDQLLLSTLRQLDVSQRRIAKKVGQRTMAGAIRDRLGCRWIEQIMLQTALCLTDLSSSPKPQTHSSTKQADLLRDLSEPI